MEKEIKKCKHRGYWFEFKFLFWKKNYLACNKCGRLVLWNEVVRNGDILHRREDGYFITSEEK